MCQQLMTVNHHMSSSTSPIGNPPSKWDIPKIRKLVDARFGKRACWWQVKALQEGKDVVAVAPTGAEKTLSFWIPILMALEDGEHDKMTFVVTPLNLLDKQNQQELERAGLTWVSVNQK